MQMTPTVLGPPEMKLPSPQTGNWGDPLGKVINDSSGTGSGNGIGSAAVRASEAVMALALVPGTNGALAAVIRAPAPAVMAYRRASIARTRSSPMMR